MTGRIIGFKGFTEVVLGMDPSGHYWFNLAENTMKSGMHIVMINPNHVKKSKELDNNNLTKKDREDPKTIAMLVKDRRYIEPYIPEGIYKELRSAIDSRWRLVKELSAIKNRISRWICIHYAEFSKVFSDWEGKAALLILNECPTPKKVVEKGMRVS